MFTYSALEQDGFCSLNGPHPPANLNSGSSSAPALRLCSGPRTKELRLPLTKAVVGPACMRCALESKEASPDRILCPSVSPPVSRTLTLHASLQG